MFCENSMARVENTGHMQEKISLKTAAVMKINPKTSNPQVVKIIHNLLPKQPQCCGKSARLATLRK